MMNNYDSRFLNSEGMTEVSLSEELLYKKLLRKNQNIMNFITNVSHDLRTPLSVILNTIKVSIMHINNSILPDDDKKNHLKYLSIIQQNSYRMLRLFNSILEVVNIESDGETLILQNQDIVNIIRNIYTSIEQLGISNNINLNFSSTLDYKMMAIDPDKIERIILNLLTNSFKHTNPGGEICLTLTEEDKNLKISVKDNGAGIPHEQLDLIFEKFQKGGKIYDNVYCKGIGIGLYVVKLFVELHNGHIEVNSEEGIGTEFIITLPVRLIEESTDTLCLRNEVCDNKIIETINIEFSDVYNVNSVSIHN